MSEDPYHAVQEEVQSSLQAASTLRASYLRIRSTAREPDSEELVWARNEVRVLFTDQCKGTKVFMSACIQLKATLAALGADLEDLEESVKYVQQFTV